MARSRKKAGRKKSARKPPKKTVSKATPTKALSATAKRALRKKLRAKTPKTIRLTVTPSMAAFFLENLGKQRPLRASGIRKWVRTIRSGLFVDDFPGGLWFDTQGKLIDGQHRCAALVKTGESFRFIVHLAVSDEVRDQQEAVPRSLTDRLLTYTSEPAVWRLHKGQKARASRMSTTISQLFRLFTHEHTVNTHDAASIAKRLKPSLGWMLDLPYDRYTKDANWSTALVLAHYYARREQLLYVLDEAVHGIISGENISGNVLKARQYLTSLPKGHGKKAGREPGWVIFSKSLRILQAILIDEPPLRYLRMPEDPRALREFFWGENEDKVRLRLKLRHLEN